MKSILTSRGVLRVSVAFLVLLGLLGGGLVFFLGGSAHNHVEAKPSEESSDDEFPPIRVKTVRPHFDKSFSMIEKRPGDVEAYYRVPLDSRVAGVISWIQVAAGSVVKKGETLVKIHVPEREERVKEQMANVDLAKAQIDQKVAAVDVAKAEWRATEAVIKALEAKRESQASYSKFRKTQAKRYKELQANRAIDDRLVDEQEDRLVAAVQDVIATDSAIVAAQANAAAAKTKIEQAKADLQEAKEKKRVAEAALGHARAMRDFATIKAPFDGVIVRRNLHANVGANVTESDTNDNPNPLLVLERQDIATIVMRVPDNFAPFITPNTEAIFETASLPGVKIHGKVTRYPTSLVNPQHDRTMPVEIDLWNSSEEEFNRVKDAIEFRDSLKSGLPGVKDGNLPIVPRIEGKAAGRQMRLLPGMFGQVTLLLNKFNNVYLLPTSARDVQGGYDYIYIVKDGKAYHQPVKVQVDDGKLMKVELLDDKGDVIGNLTGQEQVIVSNLGELSDGQRVDPVLVEKWNALDAGSKKKE